MKQQGRYLTSFQRKLLHKNLKADLPTKYQCRIKIMLLADEGCSQAQICKTLGCGQGAARYWSLMAQSGKAHCWESHSIGRPRAVNDEYLERLRELVSKSPREFGYAFQRWTARWLSKHLAAEFEIEVSARHINRLLKQMGLSTRQNSTQPAQNLNQAQDVEIAIGNINAAQIPEFSDARLLQFLPQT